MASVGTPAHVSIKPLNSSIHPLPVPPNFIQKPKQSLHVRCALSTPKWREGRRLLSISLALSHLLFIPNRMLSSISIRLLISDVSLTRKENKMNSGLEEELFCHFVAASLLFSSLFFPPSVFYLVFGGSRCIND